MSANFHSLHSRRLRHRRAFQRPPGADGDTTADVHEEFTADLEPATADIVRDDAQAPIVATPAPTVAPKVEDPAPLPKGRREPFVSAPPASSPITVDVPVRAMAPRPITVDVPVRATAPVVQSKPSPRPADVTDDVFQQTAKTAVTAAPRKIEAPKASEPRRPALAPGKVLCDRYLLEQVIGCGGTAIVFRARDMLSGKGTAPNVQVAVKTPRPELGDPERAAKRLKHEFEHARLLSHPSIVRVFDLHEDEGHCFMTMELVQGKLLSELLRDWTMVPVSLAYKILRKSAAALSYAHSQNVVHGDFKPGNVFITPEEGVRIVDFGTAAGPTANDSRIPAGTPTYASPEVLGGSTPDRRDDVFSFACVAYELLTGQHPFGRQSSLQAREEGKIPPRAWNLSTSQWLSLLSALSWKREARPTSVEDLLTRLNPEQPVDSAPMPVHADPEELVPADLPADLMPKQRSWGFFAFVACALLVTYFAFQRHNGTDDKPAPSLLPATTSLPAAPLPDVAKQPEVEAATSAPAAAAESKDETAATTAAAPSVAAPAVANKPRPAAAPMSEISFESSSVVTSESSVAAVFLIKRSQPLSGRVSVSWKTISGTADAGIDFASDATGTVSFADGQAQRAIYVPLRNDLRKEDDESFYVELVSPKSARIGKTDRAEAIIRDDD
ncbi:protein kinase domain-containing protein [Peristeroidobacter agariperforans]|uniref:protein kinase domain-containing protein n=1 Tax=Peristeroidobacter agariperforans TaxID=268404 RepID=UPI00101D3A76|nr:protein kinase [Peristeroidobacter agariperforans]